MQSESIEMTRFSNEFCDNEICSYQLHFLSLTQNKYIIFKKKREKEREKERERKSAQKISAESATKLSRVIA